MDDDLIARLALSQKRRLAGRKGAAARWGNRNKPGQRGKTGNQPNGRDGKDGNWCRLDLRNQNGGDAEADLYIYDEISWWGFSAQDLVDRLAEIDASTINVHLNSPGGDVFDGIAIFNALVNHPAKIHVQIDGYAASIASVIAMAGDTVTIGRYAQMMIHDAWGVCYGDADDMRQMADLLDKTSDNIANVYADRAGGDVEDWRDLMRAESWFSAQEAVDAGLADKIAPLPSAGGDGDGDGDGEEEGEEEPMDKMGAQHDLSRFRFSGRKEAPQPKLSAGNSEDDPSPASPDDPDEAQEDDDPPTEDGTEDKTQPPPEPPPAEPKVDLAALRAGLQPETAPHPPPINVAALREQLQKGTT